MGLYYFEAERMVSIPLITGLITDRSSSKSRNGMDVSIPLITGLITDTGNGHYRRIFHESQSL